MIQIKLLMEFKVIFFSRSTVEGDESFQIVIPPHTEQKESHPNVAR